MNCCCQEQNFPKKRMSIEERFAAHQYWQWEEESLSSGLRPDCYQEEHLRR